MQMALYLRLSPCIYSAPVLNTSVFASVQNLGGDSIALASLALDQVLVLSIESVCSDNKAQKLQNSLN